MYIRWGFVEMPPCNLATGSKPTRHKPGIEPGPMPVLGPIAQAAIDSGDSLYTRTIQRLEQEQWDRRKEQFRADMDRLTALTESED